MQLSRRFFTKLILPALAGALLLIAAPAQAWDREDGNSKPVTVMTWNLYWGFDDAPVVAAALAGDDGTLLVQAATEAWRQIHATDFHRRVRDIALQVRLRAPDLIAVQEAVKYVGPDANGNPETIDHLQILLAALRQVGLPYEVVSSVDTTAVELPVLDPRGNVTMVSLQDRSAILARASHEKVAVSNPQHGIYQYILGFPDFPFTLAQGWASVDVVASGQRFRFVTTHLEDPSADPAAITPLQEAQASELVGIFSGGLPVVFAGDFNTDGFRKWDTYKLLTGSLSSGGFNLTDAWTVTHRGAPGLTWGQSPDLLNLFPRFTQRLDLVLSSGHIQFADADVVGNTVLDRALAGMWPSDHAGLVVSFVP